MEQLNAMGNNKPSINSKLGSIEYQLLKRVDDKYVVKLPQLNIPILMNKYYYDLLRHS